jgi:hypothetical protein
VSPLQTRLLRGVGLAGGGVAGAGSVSAGEIGFDAGSLALKRPHPRFAEATERTLKFSRFFFVFFLQCVVF